jgi:hypothetical protein
MFSRPVGKVNAYDGIPLKLEISGEKVKVWSHLRAILFESSRRLSPVVDSYWNILSAPDTPQTQTQYIGMSQR